jgi:hypothetical protein
MFVRFDVIEGQRNFFSHGRCDRIPEEEYSAQSEAGAREGKAQSTRKSQRRRPEGRRYKFNGVACADDGGAARMC